MKGSQIFQLLTIFALITIEANGLIPNESSKPTDVVHLNKKCLMCKFSVSLINYALKNRRGYDEVDKIFSNFCYVAKIESPQICSSISKLFNSELTKVLAYSFITPDQVCGYIYNDTCGHFHNPLNDWEVNLNISSNLDIQQLAEERQHVQQRLHDDKPYRVIHISDTHVDLKYKEGSPAVCEEPLCCRDSSTPKNSSLAKAGFWGTYGHCDIPLRTFSSALKKLNSTIEKSDGEIDYIIWTGDIQPHDVWSQNKKSAIKIYDTVFGEIFKHLPNIKILPTLGNHEMVPVDSFSPSNLLSIAREDSPVWLYKKLNSFWSKWLTNDTIATITKDGFYSTIVRRGLKVVSLNTNFCHANNFWLFINSTDPGNQLQWLVHELQISELLHEKVHIIGHIPPGATDCLKVWSKNYNNILRRFANTVSGQFFGHTHTNEFEMFYNHQDRRQMLKTRITSYSSLRKLVLEDDTWEPISVGFIGPSITTFVNLNPSFRIYNVDPKQGFVPTDFETYFMNLTSANRQGPMDPGWESAGMFSTRFGVSDTKPQTMHNLLVDLADTHRDQNNTKQSDESSRSLVHKNSFADDKLFKLYQLFNSYSDKFNQSVYEGISTSNKTKFICRFFTGQAHNSSACNKFVFKNSVPIDEIIM